MYFQTVILYCQVNEIPTPQEAESLLLQISERLSLIAIAPPEVFIYPHPERAYLIILPIGQSHLSFETWPETRTIRILIDSCKEIDVSILKEEIVKYFSTQTLKIEEMVTRWP
ncbi:MAG: hypothetical protein DRO05_02360 [Thermoproteota archaeon]|nr:MAG: hypothetical protein DRO05_02360 [Candidatus Korarchaeota archaeon]